MIRWEDRDPVLSDRALVDDQRPDPELALQELDNPYSINNSLLLSLCDRLQWNPSKKFWSALKWIRLSVVELRKWRVSRRQVYV